MIPAAWTSSMASHGAGFRLRSWSSRMSSQMLKLDHSDGLLLGELTERPELVGWVSIDAECWQSLPPEVQGRAGAVGGDRILVANPTNGSLWIGRPAPSCQ